MNNPENSRTDPEIASWLSGRTRMQVRKPKSITQSIAVGAIGALTVATLFAPEATRTVLSKVDPTNTISDPAAMHEIAAEQNQQPRIIDTRDNK